MPTPDPQTFSDDWVRAWNAHDVEAHRGELVNEVLTFDGALVRVGHGTYLAQGS